VQGIDQAHVHPVQPDRDAAQGDAPVGHWDVGADVDLGVLPGEHLGQEREPAHRDVRPSAQVLGTLDLHREFVGGQGLRGPVQQQQQHQCDDRGHGGR